MNRILGSMRRVDEHHGAVRVEDVYDTDIDDLWSAVTDPDRLRPYSDRQGPGPR
jgi:uncharacterized protein YndB with AHSA1/START domain